jgi:hypothetical protein
MNAAHARISRRAFLLAATAGTAATAVALVAKNPAARSPSSKNRSGELEKGYQPTAHVHNYYRTAKI